VLRVLLKGKAYLKRFAVTTVRPLGACVDFSASAGSRRGGWSRGSIWNGLDRVIPKITEHMNACMATSLASWKLLVNPIRRRWIYGGRLLTTKGCTKRLACVAPGNSTSLRRGNMKERPMMWNIPRCALAE